MNQLDKKYLELAVEIGKQTNCPRDDRKVGAVIVKNGKIQFYPVEECSLTKVLVMFLDKHELIYDENVLQGHPHYYMYDDLVEILLTQNDIESIENFFNLLVQFKFVHNLKND